jgi:hypothetical protein
MTQVYDDSRGMWTQWKINLQDPAYCKYAATTPPGGHPPGLLNSFGFPCPSKIMVVAHLLLTPYQYNPFGLPATLTWFVIQSLPHVVPGKVYLVNVSPWKKVQNAAEYRNKLLPPSMVVASPMRHF